MKSIKKLFRHSSVPPNLNQKSEKRRTEISVTDTVNSSAATTATTPTSTTTNCNSIIKSSNTINCNNSNSTGGMKGIMKFNKKNNNDSSSAATTKWESVDNDSFDQGQAAPMRQYANKDKRRSSVVVSKKVWNARRSSTQSITSSLSGSSESISASEAEDSRRKKSPKEVFENIETKKVNSRGFNDFCVKKISQAPLGRKEIEIAEQEMKGFKALIDSLTSSKPLKGSKIVGCTHITSHTAVLIESLVQLGATVRWCACNMYSTQNEVAAALAEKNIPIYAWKCQSDEEFWWAINQCILPEKGSFNLILDDGGDMTSQIYKLQPDCLNSCRGIVEEGAGGIHRLHKLSRSAGLQCPVININESITKCIFDSYYLSKETVVDALKRSTDTVISGMVILVIGYGSVGKGCCHALKGLEAQVLVAEIDPICALQACISGHRVVLTENGLSAADIVITCTGSSSVLQLSHFEKMKNGCIVCNMGQNNGEINIASLQVKGVVWEKIRDDVDHLILPSKKRIVLIAQGRQANLNCSAVPSVILSITSTAETLALIELFTAAEQKYKKDIYLLPKKSDEMIARTHLTVFAAELNQLTDEQSQYLGINKCGPFKPAFYRY